MSLNPTLTLQVIRLKFGPPAGVIKARVRDKPLEDYVCTHTPSATQCCRGRGRRGGDGIDLKGSGGRRVTHLAMPPTSLFTAVLTRVSWKWRRGQKCYRNSETYSCSCLLRKGMNVTLRVKGQVVIHARPCTPLSRILSLSLPATNPFAPTVGHATLNATVIDMTYGVNELLCVTTVLLSLYGCHLKIK